MDCYICNKCYCPRNRAKRPFNLTQCGHIFCHTCSPEAGKQCSMCKHVGAASITLQNPLIPKVAPYFTPLDKSLEMLQITSAFQSDQFEITTKRFLELDKKYETLKHQYLGTVRDIKFKNQKYQKLKEQTDEMSKKIVFMEARNKNRISNRTASHLYTKSSNMDDKRATHSRYDINSKSQYTETMSVTSSPMTSYRTTSEGFLIPNISKVSRSTASSFFYKSNANSINLRRK